MIEMTRAQECIAMLEMLKKVSSVMPDCIAMENNYPVDKTITLEDIRMDSFLFVINTAIDLLNKYDPDWVNQIRGMEG